MLGPPALNSWKDAVTIEPIEEGLRSANCRECCSGSFMVTCRRHENDQQIGGKLARAPGNVPPVNRFGARFSTLMIARTGAWSFSSSAIASSALLDNPKELGEEAIFSSEVNDRMR